jgi:hypothetical protein
LHDVLPGKRQGYHSKRAEVHGGVTRKTPWSPRRPKLTLRGPTA